MSRRTRKPVHMTRLRGVMPIIKLKYNQLLPDRTRGRFGRRPSGPGPWPNRICGPRTTAILAAEQRVPGVIGGYRCRHLRRPPDHTGAAAVASKWPRSAPGLRRASRTAPPGLDPAGCPAGPRLARAATRPTGPGPDRPRSSERPEPSPSPSVGEYLRSNGYALQSLPRGNNMPTVLRRLHFVV